MPRATAGCRTSRRAWRASPRSWPPAFARRSPTSAIPKRSANALAGAVGWWAGNIGVLWASFEAFGVDVPLGVLIQGFFVGMVANLAPSPAGGVGTVDAGLIGSFVLFGLPAEEVFPAVLLFRAIGFALPIPLGIWGYIGLRRTVRRWAEEDRAATIQSKVSAET